MKLMDAFPGAARAPHADRRHRHQPRNPHREVQSALGRQDRIALRVTAAIGTMYAVYTFAAVMAGWILLQVALGRAAFDPYPFAFLLFLGNIVQLLLMPLIMVGQNVQGRHAEARADEEYRTVGQTFHDLEAALAHLDAQDRELARQTRLLVALVRQVVPPNGQPALLDPPAAAPVGSRPEHG
jgi:uncharacterized membrane protein